MSEAYEAKQDELLAKMQAHVAYMRSPQFGIDAARKGSAFEAALRNGRVLADRRIEQLPQAAGVYWLSLGPRVVYVGRAQNLHRRWRRGHHLGALLHFPQIELTHRETPDFIAEEAALIRFYQPPLNGNANRSWLTDYLCGVGPNPWQ